MVEKISEDGERRKLSAGEIAKLDQLTAFHDQISHQLVDIHEAVQRAVDNNDVAQAAELTREVSALCKTHWPQAPQSAIDFIMYLIALLADAKAHTTNQYSVAETVLHGFLMLLDPMHPLRTRMDDGAPRDAYIAKDEYITGDGTVLVHVHPVESCKGPFCVIHNPAPGPWSDWPTTWMDEVRRMGRICPHGVIHVSIEDLIHRSGSAVLNHVHVGDCDCACDLTKVEPVLNDQGDIVYFRDPRKAE